MLSRGPAAFSADAKQAEATLQRVATLDCARMIFSHGAKIADPRRALQDLLDDAGSETS